MRPDRRLAADRARHPAAANAANSVLSPTAADANGNTAQIGTSGFVSNAVNDGTFEDRFGP